MDSDLEYCRLSLERNDYSHYLISLLMPEDKRAALWVMGAFRHVIISIPKLVTDPTLGFMRLTWWRDSIGVLQNGGSLKGQPILAALKNHCDFVDKSDLVAFINDCERLIEKPNEISSSLAYDTILKKILDDDFRKYLKIENCAERLLQKHAGTKWHIKPPFLALRLWAASF